ncbi:DUF1345 domain-containing protein [Devosia oryziradicis]|uniref:DUF1345 domain-containing protein n=1 Tax=Devosia oryziradicis TaxID=2801335 RepID=A0ABX7BS97_9HYPH|nr:DUF1345 domain-containing protein [Devosia oryziradicis]QQR34819.1 DUF1345 domain-containing protein [Devosia oryziradicis]
MATGRNRTKKQPGRREAIALRIAAMRLPRHGTFFIGLAGGVLAFLIALWWWPAFAAPIGAIATFVIYLGLVGLMLPVLTPGFLRARADRADTPTVLIFATVVAIVGVCCVSLFMALNGRDEGPLLNELVLSVASVLLGWFTIQTMAALHYAYEYYETEGGAISGGLDFPEGDNPDGLAFIYFAYVIGTAFAVSDIRVTSGKMRKIVLLHSTFAYFFNTLIVAGTVNVVVAVGGA